MHDQPQPEPAASPEVTVRGALPQKEFDWIFSRVPRLTVEVVIAVAGRGVLLSLRQIEPCKDMWHLPGGTVRFGEPLLDAVARVARAELGLTVRPGELLGYIEYPSHYLNGLDSPVGIAFRARVVTDHDAPGRLAPEPRRDRRAPDRPSNTDWFTVLPDNMHDEQRAFLVRHLPGVKLGPQRD